MDDFRRRRAWFTVWKHPGIGFRHLQHETGLTRASLREHLQVLIKAGEVRRFRLGRESHFSWNGHDRAGSETVARIRHGHACRILHHIVLHPDVSHNELCRALRLSAHELGRWLRPLLAGGIVDRRGHYQRRLFGPGPALTIWALCELAADWRYTVAAHEILNALPTAAREPQIRPRIETSEALYEFLTV